MSEGDTISNTYVTGDSIPSFQVVDSGTIKIRHDYDGERKEINLKLAVNEIYLISKVGPKLVYIANREGYATVESAVVE